MGYSYSYNDLKKGDQNKGYLNTGDLAYFNKKNFLSHWKKEQDYKNLRK